MTKLTEKFKYETLLEQAVAGVTNDLICYRELANPVQCKRSLRSYIKCV